MEIDIELFVQDSSISHNIITISQSTSYLNGSFGSFDVGWMLPEVVLQTQDTKKQEHQYPTSVE